MTDDTPAPPPANDEPAQPSPPTLEDLQAALEDVISYAVVRIRLENPKAVPVGVAAEIIRWIGKALDDWVPPEVIQQALLLAFEGSHEKAMNFIEIGKATKALQNIANARKKIEGRRGGIILPTGGGDAA